MPKLVTSRRSLIGGFAALFAAPAIAKVENLMALRGTPLILPGGDVDYGMMNYGIHKLIQYRREIIEEFIRENLFSPYINAAQ